MKMNIKKILFFLALVAPALFMACKKDDAPSVDEERAAVKLSFTNSLATPKLAATGGTVDLLKVKTVKVKYIVEDGGIHPHQVKEISLNVKGDDKKISTTNHENGFTFVIGSTVKIDDILLLDDNANIIGTAPADSFNVVRPDETEVMERNYRASGLER